MNQFDDVVNQTLGPLYNKDNVISNLFTGLVYLLLIVYASQIAPKLPTQVQTLFQNTYFKLLAFFLILYLAKYSPTIALVVAIAFVLSVNYANTGKLLEMMQGDLQVQSMQTTNQVTASANNPQTVDGQVTLPPMVVQPQVVSTAAGMVVATPQVIIAPLHVTDSSGNVKVINPILSVISNNEETSLPKITNAQDSTSWWNSEGSPNTQDDSKKDDSQKEDSNQEGCYEDRSIDVKNVYPLIENQGLYYENASFDGENTTTDYAQVNMLDKVFTA
jgi:hypothetical protein